jgi:hypothetical protein
MMLTMGAYVGWKNRFEAGIVISTIFHPPTRVTLVLPLSGSSWPLSYGLPLSSWVDCFWPSGSFHHFHFP